MPFRACCRIFVTLALLAAPLNSTTLQSSWFIFLLPRSPTFSSEDVFKPHNVTPTRDWFTRSDWFMLSIEALRAVNPTWLIHSTQAHNLLNGKIERAHTRKAEAVMPLSERISARYAYSREHPQARKQFLRSHLAKTVSLLFFPYRSD